MTLNLVFGEYFQKALPEINNQSSSRDYQSHLRFYLMLALALLLFLLTVILGTLIKLQLHQGIPSSYSVRNPHSNNGIIFPPNYEDGT